MLCAAVGGELFVRGIVGIARWARVPPGIIGATFAAFATSSPELSVSITSALAGSPQIALGDALGSNVVNIGLILGGALLFSPLAMPGDTLKRDFPFALLTPVLLVALSRDGTISRADGTLMAAFFLVWLGLLLVDVRRKRSAAPEVLGEASHWRAAIESLAGLGFLVASGRLIVAGASGIALSLGVDAYVIGATLVAIGTSAPEIATVVIARIRGHDEVGLGAVLGSNIFNGLFIVSAAALVRPIPVIWGEAAVGLGFGLTTTLLVFSFGGRSLDRGRGVALLLCYVAYLYATVG